MCLSVCLSEYELKIQICLHTCFGMCMSKSMTVCEGERGGV